MATQFYIKRIMGLERVQLLTMEMELKMQFLSHSWGDAMHF